MAAFPAAGISSRLIGTSGKWNVRTAAPGSCEKTEMCYHACIMTTIKCSCMCYRSCNYCAADGSPGG